MKVIREPAVAGSFYPKDESRLKQMINSFLKNAEGVKAKKGQIVGFITPHAGYVYSGQIAAYGYNLIKNDVFETIIIMGPSHQISFKGASVYSTGNYKTPLGVVTVDQDMADKLINASEFIASLPEAHKYEHSVEVQVPFIQVVQPQAKIVPMVIGSISQDICKKIAEAIVKVTKGKRALIIASSDMSHYHPYDEAVAMDKKILDRIEKNSIEDLYALISTGKGELCGAGPVMILMFVCNQLKANDISVLTYANSGDITGDRTQGVVGYSSVVFYKNTDSNANRPEVNKNQENQLSQEEKKELLSIARTTIKAVVNGRKIPKFEISNPKLNEHRGAFVTLHENGMLRGCIGQFIADKELYKIISEMAVASSTQDYRFDSVKPNEVENLTIEISVLSPLEKVHSLDEIKLGVHGIYVMQGGRSGCFLPQVAAETGWTKEQFLEHCCRDKAGLDKDAWKKDAEIYKFSAEVFSE